MNTKLLEGLDLAKIIGGLNRTLTFANKAIPIYQQLKPIFKNASSLTNILNIMNTSDNNSKDNIKEIEPVKSPIKKVSNNNLPTFFQ